MRRRLAEWSMLSNNTRIAIKEDPSICHPLQKSSQEHVSNTGRHTTSGFSPPLLQLEVPVRDLPSFHFTRQVDQRQLHLAQEVIPCESVLVEHFQHQLVFSWLYLNTPENISTNLMPNLNILSLTKTTSF